VSALPIEDRTARLTILIDPCKNRFFERLCAEEDATPSQVVRRLTRRYIEERTGQPWRPREEAGRPASRSGAGRRASTAGARNPPRGRA
jgi:Ribbon-helix-helix protein